MFFARFARLIIHSFGACIPLRSILSRLLYLREVNVIVLRNLYKFRYMILGMIYYGLQ